MFQKKKKEREIPAEKMVVLAEQGLKKARLTRDEKLALAGHGLDELYEIKEYLRTPSPSADPELNKTVMGFLFPESEKRVSGESDIDISIRLTASALDVLRYVFAWHIDSPAFAQRGDEPGTVSFYREAGKYTIHIQIVRGDQLRSSINVRLSDRINRELTSFDVSLYQNDHCIESVHVSRNPAASFSSVLPGEYVLRVSNKKGEIVSVAIRIEA